MYRHANPTIYHTFLSSFIDEIQTSIMDVPEDCWIEVFRLMDMEELCAAANVCMKFRNYVRSYCRTFLHTINPADVIRNLQRGTPEHRLKRCFVKFGDIVQEIRFTDDLDLIHLDFACNIVRQKCSSVKKVFIQSLDSSENAIIDLRAISHGLHSLSIVDSQSGFTIASSAENLNELILECEETSEWNAPAAFARNFAKLKKICITNINIMNDVMINFLSGNPQLEFVKLTASDAIMDIVMNMPNLEKLQLIFGNEALNEMQALPPKLKRIGLFQAEGHHQRGLTSIIRLLGAKEGLKSVVFENIVLTQEITDLFRQLQLKTAKLKLVDMTFTGTALIHGLVDWWIEKLVINCQPALSNKDLLEIISLAHNLKIFKARCEPFDIDCYIKLLQVVKTRVSRIWPLHLYVLAHTEKLPEKDTSKYENSFKISYV